MPMRRSGSDLRLAVILALALMTGGCASYVTPGGPADLALFADQDVAEVMRRQPAAELPVHLAVVRVQAPGYRYHGYKSSGHGRYSLATSTDVETDEAFDRLNALPGIDGVGRLNRLLVSRQLNSDKELRLAAAKLRAEMVLIYTLDTDFHIGSELEPLGVLTLGLLPNKQARVTTVASALLLDTQTGFVFGAAESRANHEQLANAWTSDSAIDQSRRKTEQQAFRKLLDEFEALWRAMDPADAPAES